MALECAERNQPGIGGGKQVEHRPPSITDNHVISPCPHFISLENDLETILLLHASVPRFLQQLWAHEGCW